MKHAQEIAGRLHDAGVIAEAVSGEIKASDRREVLARFEQGETKVLCACDLLNEGWDCPATEVLFMARPTMSKVLYTQQLGRGMRLSPGKESLMVFDFVDNASQYNMPYSMHRLFRLKDYQPGALVLGKKGQKMAEQGRYDRGERPDALIDWPVDALDYELVDIFNWQEEAAGLLSQLEFVRRVDVQTETIERYVREGLLVPDLVVEKANSIYAKGGYTDAQVQRNILSNPFKRFEDMQMLYHTKTLGVIQVDESVWKKLTQEEKQEIERICDEKLEEYYQRFNTEGS